MSLVAAYSFDSGAIVDQTGRGHTGTNHSCTFPDGHTSLGLKAVAASSQYVSVADHADFHFGTTWTIMCWVNLASLTTGELVAKPNQWWFSTTGTGTVLQGFYFAGGGSSSGM